MAALTLKERIKYLESQRPQIANRIADACRDATIRAVQKATDMTPTQPDELRGTNTQTGSMKQHWATDSKVEPTMSGSGTYMTILANDKQYASYVNDGHRMDRHFVPGLYINPESGLLEYDPAADTGIMVGTKTSYVEGLFMVDKAKEEYRRELRQKLAHIGEVFD